MPKLPLPVIIAGVVALLVVVYMIAKGSGQQTIQPGGIPPIPPVTSPDNPNTGPSADTQSILDAITAVQNQITALPASITNDQLNAALASLQSAMQAAIDTANANTIQALSTAIATTQQALQTSISDSTQSLLQALSGLQDAITQVISKGFAQQLNAIQSGFAGQNAQFSLLQNEFNQIQSYLPSISKAFLNDTGNLWSTFNAQLNGNGFYAFINPNYGQPGQSLFINNNWQQAMAVWEQSLKQTMPGLQNVPASYLQGLFYNIYITNYAQYKNNPTAVSQYIAQQIQTWTNGNWFQLT